MTLVRFACEPYLYHASIQACSQSVLTCLSNTSKSLHVSLVRKDAEEAGWTFAEILCVI